MAERINIVLVENSFFITAGFNSLIAEFPGLFLSASYDGSEKNIVQKVLHHKPDLVVLNPALIDVGLFSLIKDFSRGALVAGLVNDKTPENVKSHFDCCLDLSWNKYEIIETFRDFLVKRLKQDDHDKSDTVLSSREQMIVREVVSGLTNQEIADKLFLSVHTVNTHRKNITNKLGIKTVSGLTVYALMNKIVDIHEIRH
ncbi:MAG: LuxR C-terminal-related transcriptional regulator [bacterium]|jgi:two-component system, NarL family, response regulator NreC